MQTWGESRRAPSHWIVRGRMKLKTNACAPPNDPTIERAHPRARFILYLKMGYCLHVSIGLFFSTFLRWSDLR